ncbi:hypothetical protein HJC23_004764 [Cyclotella cryptica]|uniref:Uncharacterized protein n=1 Tax=Cyclotella cryptica TaxID=29204 RepID=A0ABD3PE80_9STRA|eukprot:CCRYP_015901-RA/>CCRYP_015901-RA protein AED:0.34 eAED:0.34 QI:0/-1/0/1/-1/1/1/0/150
MTTSLSAKKSVSFSVTSQLKFMHYPSPMETYARWYDKDDSVRFRKVRVRDVMKCSTLVIAKKEQNSRLSEEDRVQFIGLEQDVSYNLKQNIHRIIKIRKSHVYRVLMEQERQRLFHDCCGEKLAHVSETSSKCSRAFAHRLAVSSMGGLY